MSITLGAIADDFTGASDLASILVKQGMKVIQVIGVPEGTLDLGDAQAVVVSLKSRTCPVSEAILDSLSALSWLQDQGAQQIFFKYCSTFDSTEEGNIGPVADALCEQLNTDFALICPAFPDNGRRVFQGHLFVEDKPLHESPLKDHPLTPMRDSSLLRLMSAQSTGKVGLIPRQVVVRGADAISWAVDELREQGCRYGVVDAITNPDLLAIGEVAAFHPLVTGGSAVAMGLPEVLRRKGLLAEGSPQRLDRLTGRRIVLAGSCSAATREQLAHITGKWPLYHIEVERLAAGEDLIAEILDWSNNQDPDGPPIVISASSDPDEVAANQKKYGRQEVGELIEKAIGKLACRLVDEGADRIVLAGGETSGAVVSALGIKALRIGQEIAPGVPWTGTLEGQSLSIAMKSGNFGSKDFFERAFEVLDE